MLTIIEVRIIYKTQQQKKTSTWILNKQSREEKMKRSHGIFKRQLFQENLPHTHLHNGD